MSEQDGASGASPDQPERHPSWLELFFDLVFVAAVAALAHQLQLGHSIGGLGVFAGLFVPVWWAWRGFAWYATGFGTEDGPFRTALLAGMLGVAVLAAGTPKTSSVWDSSTSGCSTLSSDPRAVTGLARR